MENFYKQIIKVFIGSLFSRKLLVVLAVLLMANRIWARPTDYKSPCIQRLATVESGRMRAWKYVWVLGAVCPLLGGCQHKYLYSWWENKVAHYHQLPNSKALVVNTETLRFNQTWDAATTDDAVKQAMGVCAQADPREAKYCTVVYMNDQEVADSTAFVLEPGTTH
jgi:hypothetical protein